MSESTQVPGRRSAVRRSLSPTAVIAVLLPLLTVGALSLVRPDEPDVVARPAEQVAPSRTDLVCPSGEGDDPLALAAAAGSGGEVATRLPTETASTPVELRQDAVTEVPDQQPAFVRGTGELAAQLIGARSREQGLAAITINPARIFGLADRVGSLEPGKDADLVIWDGDPLDTLGRPTAIFIRGEPQPMASRQTLLRDRYMSSGRNQP